MSVLSKIPLADGKSGRNCQRSESESETLMAIQPEAVLTWSYIKHNSHNIRHMKVQSNIQ